MSHEIVMWVEHSVDEESKVLADKQQQHLAPAQKRAGMFDCQQKPGDRFIA
jgi:hypothetical protein